MNPPEDARTVAGETSEPPPQITRKQFIARIVGATGGVYTAISVLDSFVAPQVGVGGSVLFARTQAPRTFTGACPTCDPASCEPGI